MICPACQGEGWLEDEPCPECDGCGLAYCCEGAPIEDPDDAKETA